MSRRDLPPVHRLLAAPEVEGFTALLGPEAVKDAARETLDGARRRIERDACEAPSLDALAGELANELRRRRRRDLVSVINGTGVLLHTNFARAPLAREALDAIVEIASGYSNLEFDLETGARGTRYERVTGLLRETTGAEDALVVNNCAAAVLLVLDTFARGREVVVARGESIEIGGGFRIPDVVARSGAHLVEVGTTNKVRLQDYERALSARTALLLRTHPSNFRVEGFTSGVAAAELCELGRRVGIPVVEDLGSGGLVDLAPFGIRGERTVQESLRDGIDLVMFSGDKLLGGPQAGIVVGRPALVARLRANPLLRALRVDKLTLAALAATLRLYLTGDAPARVPLYAMLGATLDQLRTRAAALCETLPARVVETEAKLGGGSAPADAIPSIGIAFDVPDAGARAARLREGTPPVVGRVTDGALAIDLRSVPPERDADLARALRAVFS